MAAEARRHFNVVMEQIHKCKSIRLKEYDYSQAGWYYITICTKDKMCLFGRVVNGKTILNKIGTIVKKHWEEIPKHFCHVELDEYVVMPNHLHGIIIINNVGVQNFEPQQNKFQHIIPKSLGSIIRAFKSSVTQWCNKNELKYFRWQRNYYEHIIRSKKSLYNIRQYIINNPLKWELDDEYSES